MWLASCRCRHLPSRNIHGNFSARGLALRKKSDPCNMNDRFGGITVRQQILFIQGGGAGAYQVDRQLVVSLRSALGPDYEVLYPKMPRESDPDYQNWKPRIGKEVVRLKDGAILVGHSVGGSFLLKYICE